MPEALSSARPADPKPDQRQAADSRADASGAAEPSPAPQRPAAGKSATRAIESHSVAWRDFMCVVVLTVIVGALCSIFDVSEIAYRWSRRAERYQLDELPVTLFVLAAGLAWF